VWNDSFQALILLSIDPILFIFYNNVNLQNIEAKFEFEFFMPNMLHYLNRSQKLQKEWSCQLDQNYGCLLYMEKRNQCISKIVWIVSKTCSTNKPWSLYRSPGLQIQCRYLSLLVANLVYTITGQQKPTAFLM
jgi:hypothetical protein